MFAVQIEGHDLYFRSFIGASKGQGETIIVIMIEIIIRMIVISIIRIKIIRIIIIINLN